MKKLHLKEKRKGVGNVVWWPGTQLGEDPRRPSPLLPSLWRKKRRRKKQTTIVKKEGVMEFYVEWLTAVRTNWFSMTICPMGNIVPWNKTHNSSCITPIGDRERHEAFTVFFRAVVKTLEVLRTGVFTLGWRVRNLERYKPETRTKVNGFLTAMTHFKLLYM